MNKVIKIFFLLLISFTLRAQTVLSSLPVDTLHFNLSNPKIISYRGEKIFVFDNYIDTNKIFESPETLIDGKYMAFYFNDTTKPLIEVSYLNMKKNGMQKKYFINGKISSIQNYKNGKGNGKSISYWSNGQLYTDQKYKNGNLYGECSYYDKDGKVYEKTYCKKSGRCCQTTRYGSDGMIAEIIKYNKDKSIVKKYDSKGKLVQKEEWEGRKCIKHYPE